MSPRDWKQQFFEVKIIRPEPDMVRDAFWKKPLTPKVKFLGEKEEKNDRPDR